MIVAQVTAVAILLAGFASSSDASNVFADIMFKCMAKQGVTIEDVFLFLKGGEVHKDLKCAMKCEADEFGIIQPDGTYDLEKLRNTFPAEMHGTVDECGKKTQPSADPCEDAYQFNKCFLDADPETYHSLVEL